MISFPLSFSVFNVLMSYLFVYCICLCIAYIAKCIKTRMMEKFQHGHYLFDPGDVKFTAENIALLYKTPLYDIQDKMMQIAVQKKRFIMYVYRNDPDKRPRRKMFTFNSRKEDERLRRVLIQIQA